ncbi:MAG: DUF6588 family protein [Salinibacter sp.]
MRSVTFVALFSVGLLTLLPAAPVHAQRTNWVGQQYADNYTQPLTDALGANLNAGLFRTAEVKGGEGLIPGIDLYVGVTGMGALTTGSEAAFQLGQDQVRTDDGQTLTIIYPDEELPTVFGDETSPGKAIISDGNPATPDEELDLPPGLWSTSVAPFAVLQVGAGTVVGTDAQFRFLPNTSVREYGSFSLFGVSLRHSLSQYISASPVNLAVQGTWQTLSFTGGEEGPGLEENVTAGGWALNGQISKSVPVVPITLYGGLQYEQFGVDARYTFETISGTSTVSLEQDASNRVRALAGVSATLALVQVNVDYALGASNTVSAGLGIIL